MIEEKRKGLELFIREQTIGPGAIGIRFSDLSESHCEFDKKRELSSELLNIIPGGIYSTGILFPVDDTKGELHTENVNSKDELSDSFTTSNSREEVESESDDDDDEVMPPEQQSLNQMYPNSMGMTVCLNKQVLTDSDLNLVVSGRYYTKIDLKDKERNIGVRLEQEVDVFNSFLQSLPPDDVIRTNIKIQKTEAECSFISYSGDSTDVGTVKSRIYEVKRQHCDRLKTGERGNHKSLDSLKETLFDDLRRRIKPTSPEGVKLIAKLKEIERIENSLQHILDLIGVYDTAGYGVWRSEPFCINVQPLLPEIVTAKQIYSHTKYDSLRNIYRKDYAKGKWASLSVNLQYSKNEDDDRVFMKVQLVNTSKHYDQTDTKKGRNFFSMASEEVNKRCFFGVEISVSSKYMLPYRDLSLKNDQNFSEEDLNKFIYRQYKDYGIGHGCSVKWNIKEHRQIVSTEYIPECETPDIDSTPRHRDSNKGISDTPIPTPIFENAAFFQFKWLSGLSNVNDQEVISGLNKFIDEYSLWIGRQQDLEHSEISERIRENCKKDESRIRVNIRHLSNNPDHLKLFRLMNTAMFMQLWHSVKKNRVRGYLENEGFEGFFESFYRDHAEEELFSPNEKAAWRPFQLAFILLNIDGVFQLDNDPHWKMRNEWVDLVWFPTGGGKTEAYLGLISLTILYRRKRYGNEGGGTAVIMRYTLRLLTAQQFQRATLLIMALELIRRWGCYGLGEEPIYIGLYVGKGSLPNKLKDGDDSLWEEYKKLKRAQEEGRSIKSKIQLNKCPWCGLDLNPVMYSEPVENKDEVYFYGRILLLCSDPTHKCAFSTPLEKREDQGPIPVSMCDEEIYQHPPALLFGTVDKFAQIAHKVSNNEGKRNSDSRRLFGKGNWEKGKPKEGYLPPDLIIQDELHLMMGPLGSAVALFECAIDQLCTRYVNGIPIRAKIISSTATTRNTALQIMALFDRKVNLFPKPGVNCDDSFFAFYKREIDTANKHSPLYISKRKYIGILPTGRTQMWMQLRLAAIIFTHRAIFEIQQLGDNYPTDVNKYTPHLTRVMDYYHTVLTYFNSLREVGKTESQVFTYLIKETRRVFNKVLRPDKLMHCFYTYDSSFHTGELTGRLSGEEVVEEMLKIGTPWSSERRLAHGNDNDPEKGQTPPDFVIATNMISVGIDISRFNSMIINCMPRNIAEYIQASSRVARDKDGLVITVHHPFRSRDISHYEKFIEFHEKMYSYVEPISITPFTKKALQRYLPLYIATIIRHTFKQFVERTDANIPPSEKERTATLEILLKYFRNRERLMREDTDIEYDVRQIITEENLGNIQLLMDQALNEWLTEAKKASDAKETLVFNNKAQQTRGDKPQRQLYVDIDEYQDNVETELWRIPQSLRVVDPEAVIHINPK
ncbi:hypothetical protein HNQ91_003421 [Filimonas zeae]|uniref:Helicase C-terminal domain-containing protein n=1 Tax=Filimonas zeae TaxID=1737353 RepID=A0A917J0Q0_9BACT|nr:helicase-related protein [Filimonas zeae]MDR6340356.1 hypothetical protein [Filimonas zeae]GGH72354.1 hypothetical protein GCM10011379_32680 [Filimonas zeae]